MDNRRLSLLLSSFLLGCSTPQALIDSDDINGVNANKAEHAVFGLFADNLGVLDPASDEILDLNDDGEIDGQDEVGVSVLFVRASDSPNLCDDLTGGVELTNEVSAFLLALKVTGAGELGFKTGEAVFGNGVDSLVDMGIQVISEGAVLARTGSALDAGLSIELLDETFSGDAIGVMRFDFSDPSTFDTDLDGDGAFDAFDIGGVELGAIFTEAERCAGADEVAGAFALQFGFVDIQE